MFYRKHPRVTFNSGNVVVTKQSMKAECDIHNILRQYQKTGIINHVQRSRPAFMDLPDQGDYQQALHTIMEADDAFSRLPAAVRDHFGNDASRLLAALSDPAQRAYLQEVGIFEAPTAAPSAPEPVRPPAATPIPGNTPEGAGA